MQVLACSFLFFTCYNFEVTVRKMKLMKFHNNRHQFNGRKIVVNC
jgi:hypothetical protein